MLDDLRTNGVRRPASQILGRVDHVQEIALHEAGAGNFLARNLHASLAEFQAEYPRRWKSGLERGRHIALTAADIQNAHSFSRIVSTQQRKDQGAAVILSRVLLGGLAVVLPVPVPIVRGRRRVSPNSVLQGFGDTRLRPHAGFAKTFMRLKRGRLAPVAVISR